MHFLLRHPCLTCNLTLSFACIAGVLASPYLQKYGIQDGGISFSGDSGLHTLSRYPKHGQQFKSQLAPTSHQYTSSKGFDSEQLKRSSGNYGTALYRFPTSQHPSGYLKPSKTSLKESNPQGSSKGLKNFFAPERGLLRSEPGGFTQNAPASLYTGHPAENEVNIPTVYTVPYYTINGKRPGRFGSSPVDQQPAQRITAYISPNAITEMTPHAGYFKHGFSNAIQQPDVPSQGLVYSDGLPGENAISLSSDGQGPQFESGLSQMASSQPSGSGYEHSYTPHSMAEQVANANMPTFMETPNTRPTPRFSAPRLISVENEATGEGQATKELQPQPPGPSQPSQTVESIVSSPSIANNGDSSGIGTGENTQPQSPSSRRRFHATADGKELKFKTKKRYLVRAFNQYEHGRIYQSHGSNDPKEFPIPGDSLRIEIHDSEDPGNKQ